LDELANIFHHSFSRFTDTFSDREKNAFLSRPTGRKTFLKLHIRRAENAFPLSNVSAFGAPGRPLDLLTRWA